MISVQREPGTYTSLALNGEDVVLRRALRNVVAPRFLSLVGDAGRAVNLAGLTAAGWHAYSPSGSAETDPVLHVLAVDSPAALPTALGELSAAGAGPWVIVVAVATAARDRVLSPPNVPGYRRCLVTGGSDVFCAEAHLELSADLSYGPSAEDGYVTARERELSEQVTAAEQASQHWQARALAGWNDQAVLPAEGSAVQELEAMRNTFSWRVTRPVRVVRGRLGADPR